LILSDLTSCKIALRDNIILKEDNHMKRGLAILLTLALCLTLTACGGTSAQETSEEQETSGSKGASTLTFALLPKTLSNPTSLP
jgi:predicted component of type VI protein secretion system